MNKHTSCNVDQAAVIRQYIEGCSVTSMDCVGYHTLLTILGYKEIAPGLRVDMKREVKVKFGHNVKDEYEDEYYADWERVVQAEIDANTSTSESPPGDEVGSVLREEV